MKILKYVGLPILAIILLYLLLCLAGPKDMNVTKNIVMEAPSSVVYNLANSLKATEKWNEWTISDTTVVANYNEIESGVGATSSWTSAVTGNGAQKIIQSSQDRNVRSELTFEGWKGSNFAEVNINPEGKSTNVSYSFEGTAFPFLMRGFALITGMKNMMHTNYEKSLENLKKVAENRASGIYNGYQINEQAINSRHFIMNRQEVNLANIQQFYAANLGSLFGKVQAAGIEMDGMPCGLFFKSPNAQNMTDMGAAIPVAEPVSIEGAGSFSIPAQNAVVLDFYGEYSQTQLGHEAIGNYLKDRGYLSDPPVVEEYVTDPTTEKDPNKWLTKITYYFSQGQ